MNNVPDIKDIQLPDGVSIFPIAYGWWIVLGGLLFLFLFVKLIIWGIKTSKKHYALKQISQISTVNPIHTAVQLSELLRRICIVKYPEARSFYGEQWLEFLKQHATAALPDNCAYLLANAPFMDQYSQAYSEKYGEADAEALKLFCKQWVGENL